MDDNKYLIYKFTSPLGKSYIGQTCNITRRLYEHKRAATPQAFHSAIKKYGWDNFTYETLAKNLTLDEANILEENFIKEHNTLVPNGYNLLMGGINYGRTDETRIKMSNSKLGKPGCTHTEETKQHLSKLNKGVKKSPRSEEYCKNISIAHMGIKRGPVSEETLQKLKLAKQINPPANKGKKLTIDPNTGKRKFITPSTT